MMDQSLPCFDELAAYCSDTLLDILRYHDKSLPYIYVLLDKQCQHRECQHHILSNHIVFAHKENAKGIKPMVETPYVKEFAGCMCLVDRPASHTEISAMYGLIVNSIRQYEEKGLSKIKREFKKLQLSEEVVPVRKSSKRSYVKRVRNEPNGALIAKRW